MPDPDRPANREYEPTPDDEVARIGVNDQQVAAQAGIAGIVRGHYDALLASGFSRPEALMLTVEYQKALIMYSSGHHKPPDAT